MNAHKYILLYSIEYLIFLGGHIQVGVPGPSSMSEYRHDYTLYCGQTFQFLLILSLRSPILAQLFSQGLLISSRTILSICYESSISYLFSFAYMRHVFPVKEVFSVKCS